MVASSPCFAESLGTRQGHWAIVMERPRRANAGRDMGRLISQEEGADEFYQTAYGGFEEASEDEEYEVMILIRAHLTTPLILVY